MFANWEEEDVCIWYGLWEEGGTRDLLQFFRNLHLHVRVYRQPSFRAVPGIHFEAVEEQAGRRNACHYIPSILIHQENWGRKKE